MITNRKKLRNRKQLLTKIYILVSIIVVSIIAGYLTSLKLFVRSGYISPLSPRGVSAHSLSKVSDLTKLKEELAKQQIETKAVFYEQGYYLLRLKDDSEVILSAQKDLSSQISSLQFILSRLTMEGKLFSQLDLRFDKPVIKLRE